MKRLVIGLVVALVVAGWIYVDREVDLSEEPELTQTLANSSISDPGPLDTAWFCPTGTRSDDGNADHTVSVANLSTDSVATASLTVLTEFGRGSSSEFEVEPGDSITVKASEIDPVTEEDSSALAGVTVEIIGGNGVVSHKVETSGGVAEGTCATQSSESWYFATGRAKENSREYITLMNPFPEDISVDIKLQKFATSSPTEIERFQGITLFANSVQQIPIHSAPGFEGREHTAVIVQSRQGRIIAERLQTIDETLFAAEQALDDELEAEADAEDEATEDDTETEDGEEETAPTGATGATLQLGASEPLTEWFFTAGRVSADTTHLLTVYNPEDFDIDTFDQLTAQILVEIWPTNSQTREVIFVPIEREVRPGRLEVIDLVTEAQRLDLILPSDFSAQVISQNGIPVVAERWQFGSKVEDSLDIQADLDLIEPEPQLGDIAPPPEGFDEDTPDSMSIGLITSGGYGFAAVDRWALPPVSVPSTSSTWITVYAKTNGTTITVRDTLGGSPITVSGGLSNPTTTQDSIQRLFFPLTANLSDSKASVVIEANNPIYVEAQVISETGADAIPAIPILD